MNAAPGLYRRPLPEGLVAFASDRGRTLFREALEAGGMEGYFRLAEQLHTQAEPAFCGLGSLVVVLNALALDPGRTWKGPWRWYSEELLDCCVPLERVKERGVTLGQLACLARCAGASTALRRAELAGVDELRADVRRASSAREGPYVIASYARAALGQTGEGHFSPIGGYHAVRDLVLVLDVARFKYPPHWVPLAELHAAMRPMDPDTGKSRGWIVLGGGGELGRATCFGVDPGTQSWPELAAALAALSERVTRAAPESAVAAVAALLDAARPFAAVVTARISSDGLDAAERAAVEEVIAGVRASPLFARVSAEAAHDRALGSVDPLAVTGLVLALPDSAFAALPEPLRVEVAALRDLDRLSAAARDELTRLRERIGMLGMLADAD